MECRHCGSFIATMFADTCGPGTPCAERQWARLVHRKQAEIDRLRSLLTMVAESFEDWREPTPGATTREWCERFNTYLRGCVVAQASFRPDQWAALREFMPNDKAERPASAGPI